MGYSIFPKLLLTVLFVGQLFVRFFPATTLDAYNFCSCVKGIYL